MSRVVMATAVLLQVTWLLVASARGDERATCPDHNNGWVPDTRTSACASVLTSRKVGGGHLSQVTTPGMPPQPSAVPTPSPTSRDARSSSARPAGRRVALVVGVSNYERVPILANPINDAQDMTAALKRLGFDVETVLDPNRATLEAAVRRYGDRSAGVEASVFHYSGHALEAGGRNWLLPASANINGERDLRFEAIDLGTILEQTDGAAQTSIVFLDACRDNPFARRVSGAGRGLSRGLAGVDMTATGVLVAFAAAPGQVALDRLAGKKNSPFTAAVLSQIETAGLEIKTLLVRVTKEVMQTTNGKQRPWQNSSLESEFYFVPPPASAAPPITQSATNLEAVFWDSIKTSHDPADFRAYLTKFPTGTFAQLARNRLNMLQRKAPVEPAAPRVEKAVAAPSPSDAAVAQRVVLYEEDPADPRGKRFVGSAIWRTETVSPAPGLPPELAVRADLEIPERRITMSIFLRRNTDQALPASHTIQMMFNLPTDFPFGGISSVPGILMKEAEQTRGAPLAGLVVKVTSGNFLVGLSAVDADRQRNIQLLKERSWFDVPIVFNSGRRAILAVEKGTPGERAFNDAFDTWGK
jgi:uncharacterized caspase-like protein